MMLVSLNKLSMQTLQIQRNQFGQELQNAITRNEVSIRGFCGLESGGRASSTAESCSLRLL